MHRFFLLLFVIVLTGCDTPKAGYQRVAQLHVGMTLSEVNSLLGQPRRSTSQGALTVYDYAVPQTGKVRADGTPGASYYVIVGRDGLVRSFGSN